MVTDDDLLKSFLIFPYLTAEQVCSSHYSRGSLTYVKTRVLDLVREGLLLRGKEKHHNHEWDPYLYTLGKEGMKQLKKLGQDIPHFYPLPVETFTIFQWDHFLLTNEVLICALKLPRVFPSSTIWGCKHDFELKHLLKVAIPDNWVHFIVNGEHVPIWFEVHIDTGEEKFKKKIAKIIESVKDEYRRVLKTEFVTVSFLTPKKEEAARMMLWTQEALLALNEVGEADLFRFAHIPTKDINPIELFTKPMHQWLGSHGAVTSLI